MEDVITVIVEDLGILPIAVLAEKYTHLIPIAVNIYKGTVQHSVRVAHCENLFKAKAYNVITALIREQIYLGNIDIFLMNDALLHLNHAHLIEKIGKNAKYEYQDLLMRVLYCYNGFDFMLDVNVEKVGKVAYLLGLIPATFPDVTIDGYVFTKMLMTGIYSNIVIQWAAKYLKGANLGLCDANYIAILHSIIADENKVSHISFSGHLTKNLAQLLLSTNRYDLILEQSESFRSMFIHTLMEGITRDDYEQILKILYQKIFNRKN
jgi:hypothetical protein